MERCCNLHVLKDGLRLYLLACVHVCIVILYASAQRSGSASQLARSGSSVSLPVFSLSTVCHRSIPI